jgi:hypothetical protein
VHVTLTETIHEFARTSAAIDQYRSSAIGHPGVHGPAGPGERQLVRAAQGAGQHGQPAQPAQLRLSFFFFCLFFLPLYLIV